MDRFKTASDALEYCKCFGLQKTLVDAALFETANALYSAFSGGIHIGAVKVTGAPVYVDPHGEPRIHDRLVKASAEEMGHDTTFIVFNYVDGRGVSNTVAPNRNW